MPLSGSMLTVPIFHATGNMTVVITPTDNNILAVLNPEDRSVREPQGTFMSLQTVTVYGYPH